MNRGDACTLKLNILIDEEPMSENYADELEVTFNRESSTHTLRKTLSDNQIVWNNELELFEVYLSQEDTFKLIDGNNPVQIRILKDSIVRSSKIVDFVVGSVNSREVLNEPA